MKAAVAAAIHAGGRLKRAAIDLGGCVIISVSIAEEMMEGATLARSFGERQIDWCVIGEPTNLQVAIAQRGRCRVEVELHGRISHAAYSEKGVNAAALAASLVCKLADVEHATHPLLGKRSINLIDIHSEPYPSVSTIPGHCLARFDVRFLPGESPESVLAAFRGLVPGEGSTEVRFAQVRFVSYTGEEYTCDDFAPAWETAPTEAIVRASLSAADTQPSAYQFCTNGSYFAGARGIPTAGYGPGHPADAHTVDESVEASQLERATEWYWHVAADVLKA